MRIEGVPVLMDEALDHIPMDGARGASPTLERAAEEFEAYVLKLLLSEMHKTLDSEGLFSGVTRTYQAVLEDALARRAAEAGTFGLARQLLKSWGKTA